MGRGCWQRLQRVCLTGNSWARGDRSQMPSFQLFWCGTILSLSSGMPQWDSVSSGGSPEGWGQFPTSSGTCAEPALGSCC